MKSFKFSEQEVELLIAMYEDELKEVMDYSDRLRETLSKLRNEKPEAETAAPVREGKKRGRKPKAANAPKPVTGKKRGRKPKSMTSETAPESSAAPKVVAEKKKRGRKPGQKNKKKEVKIGRNRITEVAPMVYPVFDTPEKE